MKQQPDIRKILVVDDAPKTLEVIKRNLTAKDFTVFTAPGVPEAIKMLESTSFDLVITDLKMHKVSGLDLIRHIRENYNNIEVMMITGYPTIEGAVKAVKTGAEEFLAKPFTDEELYSAVERTLEKLDRRRAANHNTPTPPADRCGIIGESDPMQKIYSIIPRAAASSATALITGESGTGKDLVARAIHYNSPRSKLNPFVPINCGGIPEQLLESELFGHVKGAFTGATESRAGFFETASGGTIFLDEISETSLSMQVKLLRVLQEKEICAVGSRKTKDVDVRIIAATNKSLTSLVKKKLFREDLFFRLNVLTINIPPLRERGPQDILLLINHFTKKFSADLNRKVPEYSDKALEVLSDYYWPGNIRELENVIQRLIIMVDSDVIDIHDLPTLMRYTAPSMSILNRTLHEVEIEHIKNVLANTGGNKTRAAEILGIDRKTLREKIKNIPETS